MFANIEYYALKSYRVLDIRINEFMENIQQWKQSELEPKGHCEWFRLNQPISNMLFGKSNVPFATTCPWPVGGYRMPNVAVDENAFPPLLGKQYKELRPMELTDTSRTLTDLYLGRDPGLDECPLSTSVTDDPKMSSDMVQLWEALTACNIDGIGSISRAVTPPDALSIQMTYSGHRYYWYLEGVIGVQGSGIKFCRGTT
uniref:Uncharacterized protein n=1 Tax=Timema monikensis TaxID=170555 RepID=A0A7R9HRI1_9NEOP|nr:unnamed protein product [Timema monikensis]